jgi:hypothetical protein
LYPGIRELIPFIVLLTFHTAFNPDTILALKLSNITVSEIFPDQFGCDAGETPARLSAIGEKARGKRNPRRTFPITTDDAFGAYMLIENVKSLTANLRRHATPADQDKLFIFHQTKPGEIRAIGYDKQSISTDNTFQYGLRKFILDHGLPRFSLANIRPTVGDVADQLTEGDIKSVQLLLGHAGSDVSFQHYFTPGAKKRAEEKLAEIQGMRTRWAETAGKRDIREPGLHDSMSSVTPGFHCLDPFDSPMPGQTAGKPCSAWLACAFCPLAAIQEDDGHGLARLIQLESHVKAAVGTIHSDRYDGVYVPMLKKLESWLGKFSEDAHMAASRISYLKPLPELE